MPRKKKTEEKISSVQKKKSGVTKAKNRKEPKVLKKTTSKTKTNSKTKDNKKASKSSATPLEKTMNLKDYLTEPTWKTELASEFEQPYFKALESTLSSEYGAGKEIFPPKELVFNAFNLTPINNVKVVILGQDPYHDNGQAMGLSFSVPKGIPVPPSLKNIYKELNRDPKIEGFVIPDHGNLESWATQGVLLLNATLTVGAHDANSHSKFGWQKFTDNVIQLVSDTCNGVVFILWGGFAHKKDKLIDKSKHEIIPTAHPSPLSFNKFNNCNCFSDCNAALKKLGHTAINWSL